MRAKSSVHTKNILIYKRCDWHRVKGICKSFPELQVVPSFTLIVESIELIDFSGFVVPSKQIKGLRVFYFVGKEKAHGFDRVLASINIVPKEQIGCIFWGSSFFE